MNWFHVNYWIVPAVFLFFSVLITYFHYCLCSGWNRIQFCLMSNGCKNTSIVIRDLFQLTCTALENTTCELTSTLDCFFSLQYNIWLANQTARAIVPPMIDYKPADNGMLTLHIQILGNLQLALILNYISDSISVCLGSKNKIWECWFEVIRPRFLCYNCWRQPLQFAR